jgi:hypothetical protein
MAPAGTARTIEGYDADWLAGCTSDEVCMFTCLIVATVAKVTATPRATINAAKTNLGFMFLPRLFDVHPTNI